MHELQKKAKCGVWSRAFLRLAADEAGTQPIEVLLIFATVLVPCFLSILLLQEVLWEYIEVETILITSPFF